MKMIIVIVKDQDADTLTQACTAASFRVTRVASTGGFLRSGVVTMLLGVDDEQVDSVRCACKPLRTGLIDTQLNDKDVISMDFRWCHVFVLLNLMR